MYSCTHVAILTKLSKTLYHIDCVTIHDKLQVLYIVTVYGLLHVCSSVVFPSQLVSMTTTIDLTTTWVTLVLTGTQQ